MNKYLKNGIKQGETMKEGGSNTPSFTLMERGFHGV